MKRARSLAVPCLPSFLLLTLAFAFPQISRAQTTAPVQPPGSVLNAGVIYGLPTCTLDVTATPPENCTMGIGAGNAAGGFFGNTNNGTKLFDVAVIGGELTVFLGNGDGSFGAPTFYNEGLNAAIAGPVFSPASVDLLGTDDYYNLYVLAGNGDGTFGAPVALGQTALSLSGSLNSSGTLNLVVTGVTFGSSGVDTSSAAVLVNQGNGTFAATNVPVLAPSKTAYINGAYALTASGATAVLELYSNGAVVLSQSVNGIFQPPVSLGSLGTGSSFLSPNSLSTFTSGGNSYLAGIVTTTLSVPSAVVWPLSAGPGGISVGSPAYFSIPSNDAASVTAADVDGDGVPDLIVLGGGQFSTLQTVNLFLSNSTPPFSPLTGETKPNTILGPGVYGTQAIVADANGDGKNDLILYQPGQGLTVMLNQGNNTFLTPTTLPARDRPVAIANADFNGDGVDDVAVVNGLDSLNQYSDNTVSVMLSESPGVFGAQTAYAVGTNPVAVTTAKVNGYQSIFVLSQADTSANYNNPVVAFLQGNGSGAFPPTTTTFFSTGTAIYVSPLAIAAGTFDKSGYPTVAVGNSDGTVNLFTYSGGTFVPSTATPKLSVSGAPAYGSSLSSLAVGDVNGDGNMDLVATLRGTCGYNTQGQNALTGGAVVIWRGNGDGTFQAPFYLTSAEQNSDPSFVTLGSLTSAALPSILVVDGAGPNCQVAYSEGPYPILFTNNGGMSFTETDFEPSPIDVPGSGGFDAHLTAAIADVNGDGANDIVLSESGIVAALLNNGKGAFSATSPPLLFYVGSSDSAALIGGSFFGPGTHDVALASLAGAVLIKGTPGSSTGSGPAATTVTLAFSPASPVASGTSVTIAATVVVTASGAPVTEGSVTFTDGSVTLGSAAVSGGTATLPPTTGLAVGTHIITANYVDSANEFATQSSGPYLFTVLPLISTFSLSPTSANGGTSVTATVTLDGPAPAGGAVVTLSSSSASATVPPTFTITSGTSGTFTISTTAVTSPVQVTITASYDGTFVAATLIVIPTAAPPPLTIPTIFESITTTDSLGNNSTLISATVISPIVENITTTDSLGSNSTLISATVIAPITETITTTDSVSPSTPCQANVSNAITVGGHGGFVYNPFTHQYTQTIYLTNTSAAAVSGPFSLLILGLSSNAKLLNASGTSSCALPVGTPYITYSTASFASGAQVGIVLKFSNSNIGTAITYSTAVEAGSGAP